MRIIFFCKLRKGSAVQPLKFSKLWLGIGCLLAAAVIVLSMIPMRTASLAPLPGWHPVSLHGWMFRDKVLHLAVYFVLMLWFGQIFRNERHLWLVMFFALFGLILEIAQGAVGSRCYDAYDFAANLAGVLIAWGLARTPLGSILTRFEKIAAL